MRYRELTKQLAINTLEAIEFTRESGLTVPGLEKKFTEKQLARFQAEFSDMINRLKKRFKMLPPETPVPAVKGKKKKAAE